MQEKINSAAKVCVSGVGSRVLVEGWPLPCLGGWVVFAGTGGGVFFALQRWSGGLCLRVGIV